MVVDFAPGEIGRIQLYVTRKDAQKTASQVRKLTGADVVINASLFNKDTWQPYCCVKADGKVLNDDRYNYRGLGWNSGDREFRITTSAEMKDYENFLSCILLIWNGEPYPYYADAAVSRSSGRTAVIRRKTGHLILWCAAEGKDSQTLPELQKTLFARYPDVDWVLVLDGGDSVQLSQEGSEYLYSSRRVHNYLCFWRKDPEGEAAKPPDIHRRRWSVKKQGKLYLSKHFQVKEFACRDGSDTVWIADELLDVLERIREQAGGKPVTILSGYRTAGYNAKVGGVKRSQHLYGTAADFYVAGVSVDTLARYARIAMPQRGGVGIYRKQSFLHVDVRKGKANWHD